MGRIKMKQVEGLGKVTIEMAVEEFLKHCRLRNLSPKTIRYVRSVIDVREWKLQKVDTLHAAKGKKKEVGCTKRAWRKL